jgi:hypothetical protein
LRFRIDIAKDSPVSWQTKVLSECDVVTHGRLGTASMKDREKSRLEP